MSAMIFLIWAAGTLILCGFSFYFGRLPLFDSSTRPWVMHRSWVPDPDKDSKAAVRRFRRPAA
jgi:hypothetical protein